jgi:hypothetical protein
MALKMVRTQNKRGLRNRRGNPWRMGENDWLACAIDCRSTPQPRLKARPMAVSIARLRACVLGSHVYRRHRRGKQRGASIPAVEECDGWPAGPARPSE